MRVLFNRQSSCAHHVQCKALLSTRHLTCCTSECTHTHTHTCSNTAASGEVFTWGSGSYGRLGHGNLRDRFSPLMIGGVLRGVGITFIACHEFHSVAVAGMEGSGEECVCGGGGVHVAEGRGGFIPISTECLDVRLWKRKINRREGAHRDVEIEGTGVGERR